MVENPSRSEEPHAVDKTGAPPKDRLDLSLIGRYDQNNCSQGNQIELENNLDNDKEFEFRYALWKSEQEKREIENIYAEERQNIINQ